jgi:nucleoside-triphosphatase
MNSADKPMIYSKDYAVAIFTKERPPQILTEKFDTFGVELIRSARRSAKLILMDECGNSLLYAYSATFELYYL